MLPLRYPFKEIAGGHILCLCLGALYHFMFSKVADTLSDSTADEVRGVAEEDGAALLAGTV